MEDGDVSGAIKILRLEDKPVYDSDDVLHKLTECHPKPSADRRHFKDPGRTGALNVAEKKMY